MRVENPIFDTFLAVAEPETTCYTCPFQEEIVLCRTWLESHKGVCPTESSYTAACLMAEEAAKGGKE